MFFTIAYSLLWETKLSLTLYLFKFQSILWHSPVWQFLKQNLFLQQALKLYFVWEQNFQVLQGSDN